MAGEVLKGYHVLRYCFDPDQLLPALQKNTSAPGYVVVPSICDLMFDGDKCPGMSYWTDGHTYEGGLEVSFNLAKKGPQLKEKPM